MLLSFCGFWSNLKCNYSYASQKPLLPDFFEVLQQSLFGKITMSWWPKFYCSVVTLSVTSEWGGKRMIKYWHLPLWNPNWCFSIGSPDTFGNYPFLIQFYLWVIKITLEVTFRGTKYTAARIVITRRKILGR